jgi:2-C-methyl-D-erythritol 4-phosphate cytidylyltransferase
MAILLYLLQQNSTMPDYAIFVAGGKGERMRSSVPKQFLLINGLPLLMHTMGVFATYDKALQFIVVLPASHFAAWRQLCETHSFNVVHRVAEGGPARFHSVKSGLALVPGDASLVAVHDAVRPLVHPDVIANAFKTASVYGTAVPVVPVRDSVREWNGTANRRLDRDKLFLAQTPQCFKASLLKKAYLQNYREEFTDDATVVESSGEPVHLIEGNTENIKITTYSDLSFAEALLKNQ